MREQFTQLLLDVTELEPRIDTIDQVKRDSGEAWIIDLEDGPLVFVEFNELSGMLCLRVPVEVPECDDKVEFLSSLLRYNGLWLETGGVCMALDEDGQDYHLLLPVVAQGLAPDQLGRLLTAIVIRAEEWQDALAARSPESNTNEPQDDSDSANFVRV
ncbi:MAG: type III secretion system chaperone [Pseudomonadota bacterium]